jgi:hypothetical protein
MAFGHVPHLVLARDIAHWHVVTLAFANQFTLTLTRHLTGRNQSSMGRRDAPPSVPQTMSSLATTVGFESASTWHTTVTQSNACPDAKQPQQQCLNIQSAITRQFTLNYDRKDNQSLNQFISNNCFYYDVMNKLPPQPAGFTLMP